MKRFLSILLIFCLCLSVCSVSVLAEDDVYINSKWYLDAEDCISIDIPNKKGDGLLKVNTGNIVDGMVGIDDMYVLTDNYPSRLLHDYYVLSVDDVITVKNISEDEEILLGIQLEAVPKTDECALDRDDVASGIFDDYVSDPANYLVPVYYESKTAGVKSLSFSKDGDLVRSNILFASPSTDLSDIKVLRQGESFSFRLPLMSSEHIWAIQVRYFAEGDNMEYIMHSKPYFVKVESSDNGCVEVYEPFEDVSVDDYYYDAVLWALDNGITDGTSVTEFSPDKICTNAEILTFLWRACGGYIGLNSDDEYAMLVDAGIKESDYYCEAYSWALANNLIGQTNISASGDVSRDAIPKPDAYCNRGNVVVYIMYKAIIDSAASGELLDISSYVGDCVFEDVPPEYSTQVNWALAKGITSGTSDTTFSPNKTCTRAEIVTFLYRAYAK